MATSPPTAFPSENLNNIRTIPRPLFRVGGESELFNDPERLAAEGFSFDDWEIEECVSVIRITDDAGVASDGRCCARWLGLSG